MHITTDTVITNPIDGDQVKLNDKPLTTGRAAASAILQTKPKLNEPTQILDAHSLAMRMVTEPSPLEITNTEEKIIQDAVIEFWTPVIAGPVLKAIVE